MRAFLLFGAVLLAGCLRVGEFSCEEDGDCGPSGVCEAAGSCSLPSAECDSGRRYSKYAPPSISGACVVEDEQPGTSDTTVDDVSGPGTVTGTGPGTGTPESTGTLSETTSAQSSSTSTSPGSPCVPAGRADVEPLLLYDFCEGEGEVVRSVTTEPYPLAFTSEANVKDPIAWVDDGLEILDPMENSQSGVFASEAALFETIEACLQAEELTMEVWLSPLDHARGTSWFIKLGGIGLFQNPGWGEENKGLQAVVDTVNGERDIVWSGTLFERPNHVVLTLADGMGTLYLDGEEIGAQAIEQPLSGLDGNDRLWLGRRAEQMPRFWFGVLHLAAIYCEALTPDEVVQNFAAGHRPN